MLLHIPLFVTVMPGSIRIWPCTLEVVRDVEKRQSADWNNCDSNRPANVRVCVWGERERGERERESLLISSDEISAYWLKSLISNLWGKLPQLLRLFTFPLIPCVTDSPFLIPSNSAGIGSIYLWESLRVSVCGAWREGGSSVGNWMLGVLGNVACVGFSNTTCECVHVEARTRACWYICLISFQIKFCYGVQ